MTRHIPSDTTKSAILRNFIQIQRRRGPAPNTLKLQRRAKRSDATRSLKYFWRIERWGSA